MYFRVNMNIKKPMLCCCFTWIVFIELNITVAFLLIRKTWEYGFSGNVGVWGTLRNGRRMILKWGGGEVDTPLRTMQFELISHIIVLRGFVSMFKKETAKRHFLVFLDNGSKKEKKCFINNKNLVDSNYH